MGSAVAVDEEETAYYRQRLHAPSLLDQAFAVQVEGAVVLAVPVGGCRKGGYLSVSEVVTGWPHGRSFAADRGFPMRG